MALSRKHRISLVNRSPCDGTHSDLKSQCLSTKPSSNLSMKYHQTPMCGLKLCLQNWDPAPRAWASGWKRLGCPGPFSSESSEPAIPRRCPRCWPLWTFEGLFLRLIPPKWNGGKRGFRDLSGVVAPESTQRKRRTLLQFLSDHFYDVKFLREFMLQKQMQKLYLDNRSFTNIQDRYGPDIAGAFFILQHGGSVKFRDREWIRSDEYKRFSAEVLKFQAVPVEAIDASGCAINYYGLDNLLPLKELRSLSLQRCPHMDDWCLSRLYPLSDSLQELLLAGCPHISERGLACLHHLQNLQRLDISDLPAVEYPGLTQILVEEMLPNCEVVGTDWTQGLRLGPEERPQNTASPIPAKPAARGSR